MNTKKYNKILVTGSKGVIGSMLLKELKNRKYNVFGVDLYHAPGEVGFIQEMSNEEWMNTINQSLVKIKFNNFLFNVSTDQLFFKRFSYWNLHILYLLVFIPSMLWLGQTIKYIDTGSMVDWDTMTFPKIESDVSARRLINTSPSEISLLTKFDSVLFPKAK